MITVERTFQTAQAYPLDRLGKPEDLLFFDIETTGFSGEHSRLYLIGCTYFRDGSWQLIQWFADSPDAEREILEAFLGFLKDFSCVVSFNGDGFDIPYLLKRCRALGLPFDFSGVSSIDIYKKIRPYRELLGLPSMKQKSVEVFLGINRQDRFTGGKLIDVYFRYLNTRQDSLYDILMLHNREDLEGMPRILPILCYPDLLEHPLRLVRQSLKESPEPSGKYPSVLQLVLESAYEIPVPFDSSLLLGDTAVSLQADGQRLILEIPLLSAVLRHFYPDYRNYYYLPFEDTAIHRSVGRFVEKSARTRATAQTCYTKKEGLWLAQPCPVWEPEFRSELRSPVSYVEYAPSLFEDEDKLCLFFSQLIKPGRT